MQRDLTPNLEQLRLEASLLHRAAFGREISLEVSQRYVDAHRMCLLTTDASQSVWMRAALKIADLEALELAVRMLDPEHILCRKLRLLVYIAEAYPESYADLVNEKDQQARAIVALTIHCFRSFWKLIKGWWLFRTVSCKNA